MSDEKAPVPHRPANPVNPGTTFFAVGWGLLAAYQLLHGLLVTHSVRFMVDGPITLLMVWATLERKRWGRLALLGMSLTVLLVCLLGRRIAATTGSEGLSATIDFFATTPGGMGAMLLLAAWTVFWLRRSAIVAEFEQGKRTGLLTAQRAIALTLVGLWALMLILPSRANAHKRHPVVGKQEVSTPQPGGPSPAPNSHMVRSAASPNRR